MMILSRMVHLLMGMPMSMIMINLRIVTANNKINKKTKKYIIFCVDEVACNYIYVYYYNTCVHGCARDHGHDAHGPHHDGGHDDGDGGHHGRGHEHGNGSGNGCGHDHGHGRGYGNAHHHHSYCLPFGSNK